MADDKFKNNVAMENLQAFDEHYLHKDPLVKLH
jgi:hypothetical protein